MVISSPGLFSSLFRILRISSFHPAVLGFPYLSASDWPRKMTSMDPRASPLEEIDRVTSLMSSTDYKSPDSEECDSGSHMETPDYSGGEQMVVNDEELRDPNDPKLPDEPIVENIINATDGTDNLFRAQFNLPPYVSSAALRRSLTKKGIHLQLMREMHTTIKLPHNKKKEGKIVVTGNDETNVLATYRRIREVFTDNRRALGPTHFVSIPMNTPNIRERFESFKSQVLSAQDDIENGLFTSAAKLHLTLCVLTVASEKEHDIARRRLNDCQKSVIEPLLNNRSITVRMRGIDIMNNDPTKAKVLYATVESTDDVLQRLADSVEAFYADNGSSEKDKQNRAHVKLHVTLMNSKFLAFGRKKSKKSKPRFDATDILKNFKEFDFGEVVVNTLHLSQMRSPSKDEYYTSSNSIQWA